MIIEVHFYFLATSRDENGSETGKFGVEMNLGEIDWRLDTPFNYSKAGEALNKERILESSGLDTFVKPEDLVLVSKEEYEAFTSSGGKNEEDGS